MRKRLSFRRALFKLIAKPARPLRSHLQLTPELERPVFRSCGTAECGRDRKLSRNLNNDICDIVSLRFVTCKRPSGTIYAFSEVAS